MGYFLEVIPQTHTCFSLYKICLMIIQKLFEIKPCTIVLLNLFYVARFLMLWINFFFCIFLHGSCSHACPYFWTYNKLHLKCYFVKLHAH
jgi:hypothetical protein